eukprot:CAMPEP_0194043926 /NCGR_PEP_ID=MMETSP0009_2-20130614/15491_1 /TAXON_ID=210454 /ORGANISM="Grammatophora oceanica, Strain CCMP 410" /LENGTH=663 /DNA_ID=CAMNT_0038688319 /DNA_START=9 /DNA_END=1997 /DNA_ORIENTATION=+
MAMPANGTLTTYPSVVHKHVEGTLILSPEHLSLQPSSESTSFAVKWSEIAKHQVSPITHSKQLLRLILKDGKSLKFQFSTRKELERARNDVSGRLKPTKPAVPMSGKKRPHAHLLSSPMAGHTTNFGEMDPTALAVTRSTLLSSNPTLRSQHRYLVQETGTVSEDDFWETHQALVEEEYAKISGTTRAGTASVMQSHLPLQGRVKLGVEEMRQIFILYPAVHKAYEEKVPLELSDEQFWRKYLESEFFHRDRGRLGTAARNMGLKEKKQNGGAKNANGGSQLSTEEEDARAAAVGTDDLFGRYEEKLRKESGGADATSEKRKHWGTQLALGQFDLTSTFETERGQLLEGPKDNYPPNTADDGRGQKVIEKYNRHWAMVLHPEQAVAGSDLMDVARRGIKNDTSEKVKDDAKAHGGVNKEMARLVKYANAPDANQAQCMGMDDDDFEELNLSNIEKYLGKRRKNKSAKPTDEDAKKRQVFGKAMAAKLRQFCNKDAEQSNGGSTFPPAALGRELLSVLTKRMAADAKTDEDTNQVVDQLDADFKTKLETYFRRSSELLRHFYALRKLDGVDKKLARIVQGLEAVYREMEIVRKALPQTEDGEIMRKMCSPIMEQLDEAFKLHRRDDSGAAAEEVSSQWSNFDNLHDVLQLMSQLGRCNGTIPSR